jgi:endonuclease G
MIDDSVRQQLDSLVRARIERNEPQIAHSLRQIAAGNPLGAEPQESRRVARLAIKTGLDRRQAEALSASIRQTAEEVQEPPRGAEIMREAIRVTSDEIARPAAGVPQPEAVWGTPDFVGVQFFTRGRRAANAVGRVMFRSGRVQGTGFLVAPGVLLTNNHVIESAALAGSMVVQFDFELDDSGFDRSPTVFGFDAARCFVFSPIEALDFSLVALGNRITGVKGLDDFGYLPLSDAGDKHMLGELANIVQHPEGRPKQIVIRDNNLVARDETLQVLHYIADTEPGSSGSPVFNNEWEPIALHHWGGPHLETKGIDGRLLRSEVNEGIRISAIVKTLRRGQSIADSRSRATVTEVLQLWDESQRTGPVPPRAARENADAATGATTRHNNDGSISWIVPIEINVRAPLLAPAVTPPIVSPPAAAPAATDAEKKSSADDDFSDRGGYEPGFIPGFQVPLPDFSGVPYRIAKNLEATGTDDRFELRYHHFSVVMNAERRLAAFTACNIDGSRIKAINRQTKAVTDNPTLQQLDAESFGAEASDAFRPDRRVHAEEQMTREFYEGQKVPGFEQPAFPGKDASASKKKAYARAMAERTARMLQKGHIVLRGDPAWGTDDEALAAENDTFHYTNAAPQLGFFNQGSRDDHPGEKGKLRWRTVETYVLRNAVTERQRICVFAGPVFDDDDPGYRFDSKLPLRFWKIAVWASEGRLRSVAVIADQGEVLERLTQGVPEALGPLHGAEAFDDPDELARLSQFLTTVAEIERLTGLDFGEKVRDADIRAGEAARTPIDDFRGIATRKARKSSPPRGSRRRTK